MVGIHGIPGGSVANGLPDQIRALLTDRATPEAWLRVVALLSDAADGDAQRARVAFQQQVAGWGPTAPTPSVVGTWKVKRATYFAGELEAADAIDWSAPWQHIDLDDADGFPTGFLKWGPSEHLQYYLTVFADGRYVDADLRRGPLTFEDLTPQFDIDEEEQAAWHARAESFPVGAVTAWLRRVADATYPADPTIFDAVTK